MSARVSVIVTTRNNAGTIGKCLASVQAQDVPVEIVVVDNGSHDATVQIASAVADIVTQRGPERSAQRNYGAELASADYLLFIDSDMVLAPSVVRECLMEADAGRPVVVVPEESFGEGYWAACKALERSFYLGVDWIEAPRFYSRELFAEVGGYDERLTGPEDIDLPQRIAERHGRVGFGRTTARISHDEGRLRLGYTLSKKRYYAATLDTYRAGSSNTAAFRRQASPLARYQLFLSQPRKLLAQPSVGAGMLFMKTAEFAAGASGYLTRARRAP